MEPLKPETKRQILQERPQASPADIEEYERLLAERFAEDPDLPKSPIAARTVAVTCAGSAPDLLGELDDEAQLCPLLVVRELVPLDRRREAALR